MGRDKHRRLRRETGLSLNVEVVGSSVIGQRREPEAMLGEYFRSFDNGDVLGARPMNAVSTKGIPQRDGGWMAKDDAAINHYPAIRRLHDSRLVNARGVPCS